MRPILRITAVGALALLGTSCFEPPVSESLLLEFLPEGLVAVTVRLKIREPHQSNAAVERRIEETRRAAVEGSDDWSRRFAAFAAPLERGSWEKLDGRLTEISRSATTEDPEALTRFFADTGVAVAWHREDSYAELNVYPPPSGNATREERQAVARALSSWSALVADHLQRVTEMWTYIEEHPDRARPCLARILWPSVTDDDVEATGEVTSAEAQIIERVNDAMSDVSGILQVAKGEAYSLDEMSRHVYDPFPAPIEVALPGAAEDVEGFTLDGNRLRAGGTSLWQALRGLEGRWLTPDPMLAAVEFDLHGAPDRRFDLDAFVARPRRHGPAPSADQVRAALIEKLEAPTRYRARWAAPMTEGD
jgi:hypothetical protein